MAINKNKNVNLQLTINKSDIERLNNIIDNLSLVFGMEITKSQAITYLIRNYGKDQQRTKKESKPNRAIKNGFDYSSQIVALKDKLNVSYPRLSQILGIPASTLKKYASGKQQPTGENESAIIQALKDYGIK